MTCSRESVGQGYLADMARQVRVVGCPFSHGHGPPRSGLKAALARELTVGETYFFRNNEQFRALAEVVLPERLRIERSPRVLRVLSAGCSSGEEPYSMGIVASETVLDPAWSAPCA